MVKAENVKKIEILINKLPEPEKERAVICIDDKTFSWIKILEEFKKDSDLANKIESKLMEKIQ